MSFSDLVRQVEKGVALTNELTLEQEREIVSDNKLKNSRGLFRLVIPMSLGFPDQWYSCLLCPSGCAASTR